MKNSLKIVGFLTATLKPKYNNPGVRMFQFDQVGFPFKLGQRCNVIKEQAT